MTHTCESMLELHAVIAEMYLKSYHGLFSYVKDTKKMGENLSFHIGEYLLNSLYILNETLCKSQHVQTAKNRSEKLW